jgi:Solute carrier family 35
VPEVRRTLGAASGRTAACSQTLRCRHHGVVCLGVRLLACVHSCECGLHQAFPLAQVLMAALGYNAALFAFYSTVPTVLKWGGVTILNLSLLASDLWVAAFRNFLIGDLGLLQQNFQIMHASTVCGKELGACAQG